MSISAEIVSLISHTRQTVEELANTYHDGGAWGNGLAGYCGIASRFLIGLFKRNNLNAYLVCGLFDGQTHCWVEYQDFCIDLTISQFEGFEHKKFSICVKRSEFYRKHYTFNLAGVSAVRYQKQWELGQNYESCSGLLWRIHKANYIKEYNGRFLR